MLRRVAVLFIIGVGRVTLKTRNNNLLQLKKWRKNIRKLRLLCASC